MIAIRQKLHTSVSPTLHLDIPHTHTKVALAIALMPNETVPLGLRKDTEKTLVNLYKCWQKFGHWGYILTPAPP